MQICMVDEFIFTVSPHNVDVSFKGVCFTCSFNQSLREYDWYYVSQALWAELQSMFSFFSYLQSISSFELVQKPAPKPAPMKQVCWLKGQLIDTFHSRLSFGFTWTTSWRYWNGKSHLHIVSLKYWGFTFSTELKPRKTRFLFINYIFYYLLIIYVSLPFLW